MNVGLFNIDSKIPNLALMKLSAWHKAQGDDTEIYEPMLHKTYSKVYASKIFKYPHPNDDYVTSDMVCGGTGYDLTTTLPEEVEKMYPDYDLYDCKHAMGFLTRGCIRKCGFCVVPERLTDTKKILHDGSISR